MTCSVWLLLVYEIETDKVEEMNKSELKKKVKTRVEEKMARLVEEALKKMKKLRFNTTRDV